MNLAPPTCDDRLLWDVWLSFHHLPALVVADELGLFTALWKRPATCSEVAADFRLTARGAETLLGVLTSLGFLAEHAGRFHLTDASRNFLMPEAPYYWGGMLHRMRVHPATAAIREALLQDAERELVTDAWERGRVDPERVRAFTRAMHSHSFPAAMGVARHGDFTGVRRLLDVGGGSGCFCLALAQQHPELRCTVAELPEVCELAEEYAAEYGLGERVETVHLDMFRNPWPTGYDAVFFSNIFHDWEPERCRLLARKAWEALPRGGRVYVHEMLLADSRTGPLPASAFSMSMLLNTRGKQYSAAELEGILESAGFPHVAVTPTYAYYSLVSAVKP